MATATEVLTVRLFGRHAATITRSGPSRYRFEYDREWVDDQDAVPVSLSLPTATRVHEGQIVSDFLDNLLPDSERVRDRWATESGLDSTEPFLLLAEYGHDVAGALEFVRDPDAVADAGLHEVDEVDIGRRIAALRADSSAWIQHGTDAGRFSLAGAQGKFALTQRNGRWFEASGTEPSTHIFKPKVDGVPDGEVVEYVIMRTTRALGVDTAPVELRRFAGERSLVVERFDRTSHEAENRRLHQEHALQALGAPRLRKYEQNGGPGYRAVLGLLDRAWPEDAEESKRAFISALAFSWIVLNTDAHAKNYTVFIEPGTVRFAPLYDVSSFVPFVRGDDPQAWRRSFADVDLSMSVLGHRRAGELDADAWRSVALDARLDPVRFLSWMRDSCERIPDLVQAEIRSLDPADRSPAIDALYRRIRLRTDQAARALSG